MRHCKVNDVGSKLNIIETNTEHLLVLELTNHKNAIFAQSSLFPAFTDKTPPLSI